MVEVPDDEPAPSGTRAARAERVRRALTVAALDLYAAYGFDATTVDQIAARAEVGRRTFFRYFRSKEDAVFPGHDQRVAQVDELLDGAAADEPAWDVVSRASQLVLDMYLAEPEISLRRFALTRTVDALRDKEIASIDQYQRAFTRFLRHRYTYRPDGRLWAAVTASSVVAAHNHVLRQWLKSGGEVDGRALLRRALTELSGVFDDRDSADGGVAEDIVVGVVRTSRPVDSVLQQVRAALDTPGE